MVTLRVKGEQPDPIVRMLIEDAMKYQDIATPDELDETERHYYMRMSDNSMDS